MHSMIQYTFNDPKHVQALEDIKTARSESPDEVFKLMASFLKEAKVLTDSDVDFDEDVLVLARHSNVTLYKDSGFLVVDENAMRNDHAETWMRFEKGMKDMGAWCIDHPVFSQSYIDAMQRTQDEMYEKRQSAPQPSLGQRVLRGVRQFLDL